MDGFLLSRADGILRASGRRAEYLDTASARDALSVGDVPIVVGALPFDPSDKTELVAPTSYEFGSRVATPLLALPRLRPVQNVPQPSEHVRRVSRLIDEIKAGRLRKVVAARSVVLSADDPIDPELLVAHMVARHPLASGFTVGLRDVTLVGATPELLLRRRGPHVTLFPLAGTLPRRDDPAALLASAKNLEEHRYVVDWIRAVLTPLCSELDIPSGPELVSTPEVWHLATPIRGILMGTAPSALDLATALHPTPAVCGTPQDLALATIVASEEDRGFYGGAVGWCDQSGDGDWVVAIRCAELSADHRTLRAYAGGGIVATSDPQDELDETTAKLRTVLAPFTVTAC